MFRELENIISDKKKTILFAGIGNVLKKDDGAGVFICKNIPVSERIRTLSVEMGIENYIGKINSLNPDILILVDCTDTKSKPGTIKLLSVSDIQDLTFNTHNISLKRLTEFFLMPSYILGIQPSDTSFGEGITAEIMPAVNKLIYFLNKFSTEREK